VIIGLFLIGAIGVFVVPILRSRLQLIVVILFVVSYVLLFIKEYRWSLFLFIVSVELDICYFVITQDIRFTIFAYLITYGYLYLKLNPRSEEMLREKIVKLNQAEHIFISWPLLKVYWSIFGGTGIYYSLMGDFYLCQNRYTKAIDAYRKAQSLLMDNKYLDYNIGICLYQSDQYEDAVSSFVKCIQNGTCLSEAINNLIATYFIIGQYKKCNEYCELAMKKANNKNVAHYFGGLLLEKDSNSQLAVSEYGNIEDGSSYAQKRDIRVALFDYNVGNDNKILTLVRKYSESSDIFREAWTYLQNRSSAIPWLMKPIKSWTMDDRIKWASL